MKFKRGQLIFYESLWEKGFSVVKDDFTMYNMGTIDCNIEYIDPITKFTVIDQCPYTNIYKLDLLDELF
jgi:hypothetical protein